MNRKEKTVLIFLCLCFIVGAGISFIRHEREQKNLDAIVVKRIQSNTMSQIAIDSINNEDADSSYETLLININTASSKELDALPGIGPALAQRIIDYRQKQGGFKTKEEILKVSGIGPKKFTALKDKITINR